MPIIKLENGTEVNISQESYKALQNAVTSKKEKSLTYKDIAEKLFNGRTVCFIASKGNISHSRLIDNSITVDANNAPNEFQLEQILAINKLKNVAYYLNEGWMPNWYNGHEDKYYIIYNNDLCSFRVTVCYSLNHGAICFKAEELANEAIEIFGEDQLKVAFGIK